VCRVYYVCRNLDIFQLVSDTYQAWHAGNAAKAYQNPRSLGIECEHRSGQDWPAVAAGTMLFLLPILVFTVLLRRHLLRGITFGAVRK